MFRFLIVLHFISLAVGPAFCQSLGDLGVTEVALLPHDVSKAGEPAWTSETYSGEATGLVVSGRSSDRRLSAWGRFNDEPWRELTVVFSATGETFYAGFHGQPIHPGGQFDVRFQTDAEVSLDAAGVFDNRLDADRTERGIWRDGIDRSHGEVDRPLDHSRTSAGVVVPPRMYARAEWNADPFQGDPVPLARPDYLYMAFHHAAGFSAHSHEEGLDQLKAIQNLHQDVLGWSDIGYHFVMDQNGRLYQGRPFLEGDVSLASAPELVLGAHVGGTNTGNVGICVLGCYHPPAGSRCENVMTEAAIDSLAVMYAFISENYGIPPEKIRGHRQFETANTACPGDNNMAIIEDLRDRVRTYLVTGNAPLGAAQIVATSDEDGVVHLQWTFTEDRGISTYRIEREQGGETTVIFVGEGAEADGYADGGATLTGQVVYRLYASSAAGREQLLAAIEVSVGELEQYILSENYPDPFSRSTTIRYYLPLDGIVHLSVYDLLGRQVALVDEGDRSGGRWYDVEFDASGLPAGTYYYRLTVEGFSGTVYNEARSLVRVR